MGMNVGFAGTVTSFMPNGYKFEDMLGVSPDATLAEIEAMGIPLSNWLTYVPPYSNIATLERVMSGAKSAPSVQVGVNMAASLVATETLLHITNQFGIENNRRSPIEAPYVRYMDAMTGEAGVVPFGQETFMRFMATIIDNNTNGRVPETSY
jgi:hypothetical protein